MNFTLILEMYRGSLVVPKIFCNLDRGTQDRDCRSELSLGPKQKSGIAQNDEFRFL